MKTEVFALKVRFAMRINESYLTEKEKEVVSKYYGLNDDVRHNLEELASIYGVTRERIRQIKVVALNKLGL